MREGFAAFYCSGAGLSVTGQCADSMAALGDPIAAAGFRYSNVHVPKLSGVQVVKKVKEMKRHRVIILSIARDEKL